MRVTVEKVENGFLITTPEGKMYIAKEAYGVHTVIEEIFKIVEDETDES